MPLPPIVASVVIVGFATFDPPVHVPNSAVMAELQMAERQWCEAM